jgi:hypothetical protein
MRINSNSTKDNDREDGKSQKKHKLGKEDAMVSHGSNKRYRVLTCEFVGDSMQIVPLEAMETRFKVQLTSREVFHFAS